MPINIEFIQYNHCVVVDIFYDSCGDRTNVNNVKQNNYIFALKRTTDRRERRGYSIAEKSLLWIAGQNIVFCE